MTRWSFVLISGLVACGGGGSEPDEIERTAVQSDCDELMNVWCESAIDCVDPSETERTDQLYLCLDVAKRTCDAAFDMDDDLYAECLASVESLDAAECDAIRASVQAQEPASMPGSCAAVFVTD